jgi:hypothetical protein
MGHAGVPVSRVRSTRVRSTGESRRSSLPSQHWSHTLEPRLRQKRRLRGSHYFNSPLECKHDASVKETEISFENNGSEPLVFLNSHHYVFLACWRILVA